MDKIQELMKRGQDLESKGQPELAIEQYKLAIEMDSPEARYRCAKALIDHYNDEDSINEAKQYLWDSYEDSKDAEDLLLKCYSDGLFDFNDEVEIFDYDKILAARGDEEAMYDLGVFCMDGVEGWEIDEDPVYWFKMSSAKGFKPADVRLALIDYMNGDELKARMIFEDTENWNDLSKLCLGIMHWNGDAGFKKSTDEAIRYWNSFIDMDSDDMIGFAESNYEGKKIDIDDALKNVDIITQNPYDMM